MRYLIVSLVSILFFIPKVCLSQGISLRNVILNSKNNTLIINISLKFVNSNQIEKLVSKSGLHIIFSTEVKINEKRNWIWDKNLYSKELKFLIKFNPITNKFVLINLSNSKQIKVMCLKSILKRLENISLKIPWWTNYKNTHDYSLILKFSMKKQVPYWLKKILFFWNWDMVPTVTYDIDFKY